MVYKDNKPAVLFKDGYKPAELYKDGRKITGYTTDEYEIDKSGAIEGTYDDVLELTCRGKHEQTTYTGSQLLDLDKFVANANVSPSPVMSQIGKLYTYTGVDVSYLGDGRYLLNGVKTNDGWSNFVSSKSLDQTTVYPAGTYCTSAGLGTGLTIQVRWVESGTTQNLGGKFTASSPFVITGFYIAEYASAGRVYDNVILPKVVFWRGDVRPTDDDYEPYVGGIPSPSPDYPQEIIPTQAEVVVSGKNLWYHNDFTTVYNGVRIEYRNGVAVLNGVCTGSAQMLSTRTIHLEPGTYVLSSNGNQNVDDPNAAVQLYQPSPFFSAIIPGNNLVNGYVVFTLKNAVDAQVRIRIQSGISYDNYILRPQIERGSVLTDYAPYRTPQTLITEYQLYGADGVYDTLEPCVLVDGEWKCRVTRQWKKQTFTKWNGDFGMRTNCFVTWLGFTGGYKSSPRNDRCELFSLTKNAYTLLHSGEFTVESGGPETRCFGMPLEIDTRAKADAWIQANPVTAVWRLLTPTVELYPPIMLHTNPYCTVINGNTSMLATAKTVDYSQTELTAMLDAEYDNAIGELQ